MKRTMIFVIVIMLFIFGTHLLFVQAACTANGTPGSYPTTGNDTIICDDTATVPPELVGGQGGNDTIVVEVGSKVEEVADDGRADSGGMSAGGVPGLSGVAGSDTIMVSGTVIGGVYGDLNNDLGGENDTIIVTSTGHVGTVAGDSMGEMANALSPDVGDDTIVINAGAVVDHDVVGDNSTRISDAATGGNDRIIVKGTVGGDVLGQVGNDNITIGGTVQGTVDGGLGNDTVTLISGANGGSDSELAVNGGTGRDKLIFGFTITSEEDYNALATLIASNAPSGSIIINGQTITRSNFEELVNALIANFGLGSKLTFKDNRLNQSDAAASALVYCRADGFQVFYVDPTTAQGSQAFTVSSAQIEEALAKSVDQSETVEIKSGAGVTLQASPDGQLSVLAPDISDASKTYQFTFETSVCN